MEERQRRMQQDIFPKQQIPVPGAAHPHSPTQRAPNTRVEHYGLNHSFMHLSGVFIHSLHNNGERKIRPLVFHLPSSRCIDRNPAQVDVNPIRGLNYVESLRAAVSNSKESNLL